MTTPGLTSNVNCSVPGCRSVRRKFPHLMYHSFPKSGIKVHVMNNGNSEYVERLKLWIVKLKMGRKVTKSMKVCSLHFNDDDYEQSGAWIIRKRLKQTAVPSRNLPKSVLKNRQKQELQTEQRTSRRLRLQIKMNNCEIKLEQPEFILIKHEPEDIEIKEEVDHIEQEFSTANFDESSYKYKANINNCDDFNFLNMKLKQEELVIKDESDEITEEERSLEIIKFDTNAPKLCIRDHAATSENKVNTVEYFDNSPTHYNQMITVPEHVATSKTEKHPNSKSPNKIEDNNKDEDWIVPEFSTSDLTQGTFNCEVCKRCFPLSSFKKHMLYHKNAKHKCDECGKCFGQNKDLKVHKLTHTGEKPFKCPKCQKCFTRSDSFKTHMFTHNTKKPFKCQQCGSSFTRNSSLKTHMLIHENKKAFKCQQCDKSFNINAKLKLHMSSHEGKKPFVCQQCDKTFIQSYSLKTHVLLVHKGHKPFKCQLCDKTFSRNETLKTHILTHEDRKPFKCQQCDKGFSRKSKLTMHMLVHDNKKPFKCRECRKKFLLNSSLKVHMLLHENTKVFKCQQCDQSFSRNSNLKEHMFIHSGNRRFQCCICGKAFTRNYYLQQHILMHEAKKIFKCDLCDKSFTCNIYLNSHMLVHGQETV